MYPFKIRVGGHLLKADPVAITRRALHHTASCFSLRAKRMSSPANWWLWLAARFRRPIDVEARLAAGKVRYSRGQ